MSADRVTVTFLPDGQQLEAMSGRKVMGLVLAAGRPIGRSCRGAGVCLACGVWIDGPQSAIEADEAELIARRQGPVERGTARWRIACLARVAGDVTLSTDYW